MNPKAMLLAMTVLLTGIASAQTSIPASTPPASRPTPPMAPMTTAEALAEVVPQMAVKGSPTYAPNLPKRTRRCLITGSGAVGDGKTVNTKSIQSAIDKCAANKNGGTVVVSKGTFLSGSIFLKQGVNLLVEKDGVLKGTTNIDDYPEIPELPGGLRGGGTAALVNADGVTGVTISGEGTIDGSGEEWVLQSRRPPASAGKAVASDALNAAASPPPAAPRQERGRPRLMAIKNVKDVQISGLNLHNQATWCLWILYSQNVEIDGVKITAEHNIPTSDGMDIESSKHVHVNHSYLEDDDDCISIKSGKDADGLRVNRPAEDILIENSHFAYGQGGVAMGSEVSGSIRNVTTLNCLFDDGNWAPIRFKSQPSRGGVVENITYKDIVVRGTRQAFEMNMEWRMVGPRLPDSNPLPVMRNIKIINVTGDVQSVGNIHGLPGSPIQGVTFENCKIAADRGFRLDHARSVDLKGLSITVKQGDPVTTTDVQ
jgi:polygalacturonase